MNLVLSLVWMLRYLSFFVLLDLVFVRVGADYPGGNRYYSGSGTPAGVCQIAPCSASACQAWQYLSGCTFASPGACTSCSLPVLNALQYYSSSGGFVNNCGVSNCQTCPDGQYNTGCGGMSAGSCTTCGTPPTGKYWKPNSGPIAACIAMDIPTCSVGYYNSGVTYTSPGTCAACPLSLCLIGQYLTGCTSATSGTCASCTGANNTQEFITYGQTAGVSTSCQISGCVLTCSAGNYISGCSGASTQITCKPCSNAVAGVTYYDKGTDVYPAYTSITCSLAACQVCANGYYTAGCSGSSPGTCTACTNTV